MSTTTLIAASLVGIHGRWSAKNVRVSSRLTPLNGRLKENQNSASETRSVECGPNAVLVDQPRDRRGEHQRDRRRRDQQQEDLAHAVARDPAQAVAVLAGGEPAERREQHGGQRHAEHALGQHVDPNAASIARGAWSDTSEPRVALMTRSKLMIPRPSVTGTSNRSTCPTRGSRQSISKRRRKPRRASTGNASANCTTVPISTADRVRVELVGTVEQRLEPDQQADDDDVPGQRREGRHREVVVGVEDPDAPGR